MDVTIETAEEAVEETDEKIVYPYVVDDADHCESPLEA